MTPQENVGCVVAIGRIIALTIVVVLVSAALGAALGIVLLIARQVAGF